MRNLLIKFKLQNHPWLVVVVDGRKVCLEGWLARDLDQTGSTWSGSVLGPKWSTHTDVGDFRTSRGCLASRYEKCFYILLWYQFLHSTSWLWRWDFLVDLGFKFYDASVSSDIQRIMFKLRVAVGYTSRYTRIDEKFAWDSTLYHNIRYIMWRITYWFRNKKCS